MTTILLTFLSVIYFATLSNVRLSSVCGGTSSSTGTDDSLPILAQKGVLERSSGVLFCVDDL